MTRWKENFTSKTNSNSLDVEEPKSRPVLLESCSDCIKYKGSKREKMAHYKACHPEFHARLLKQNCESWKSAPSSRHVKCDVCLKDIRKCNLKDHKLHVHGLSLSNESVEVPHHSCDICDHVTKYAKDLKKHKKSVHERLLNFSCRFCGKKFYNKGNLNQHEVIHTGVTP